MAVAHCAKAYARAVRSLAVLALVGCGRLSFDNAARGDASGDSLVGDSFVAPCTGPDEDGDAYPNACDNCPTEPSGNQGDGDNDGIGDVCDPRPTTPGDVIEFFDPFDDQNPRYMLFGTRAFGGGLLRLGDDVAFGQAFFTHSRTITRIDFAFEIVSGSPTDTQYTGVWTHIDTVAGPPDQLFSEGTFFPTSTVRFRLKETSAGGDRYSPDISDTPGWIVGQRYRSITDTSLATGGEFRLTVTLPDGRTETTMLDISIPPGNQGFLESDKMTTDYAYLIVYAAP